MITFCKDCDEEIEFKYHFKPVKGIKNVVQAGISVRCLKCGHINHITFIPTKVKKDSPTTTEVKKTSTYIG